MPGPRALRGSGMAQQAVITEGWRPYRYLGNPDWVPGATPPEQKRRKPSWGSAAARQAKAARRMEEFGRLRGEGLGVAEAGARVGVSESHARKYEKRRRDASGQGAS